MNTMNDFEQNNMVMGSEQPEVVALNTNSTQTEQHEEPMEIASSPDVSILETTLKNAPAGTRAWIYVAPGFHVNSHLAGCLAEFDRFCAEHGWQITRRFIEPYPNSTINGRPVLTDLLAAAKSLPREADIIVVQSLSRLARTEADARSLVEDLKKYGWVIKSLSYDEPDSLLNQVIPDFFREKFLSDLREATVRGLKYLADCGFLPCGNVPIGYQFNYEVLSNDQAGSARRGKKLYIDPQIGPLIHQAFEMKATGATNSAIAATLGKSKLSAEQLSHIFQAEYYTGKYIFAGQEYHNIFPPIIEVELFHRVQKKRRPSQRNREDTVD